MIAEAPRLTPSQRSGPPSGSASPRVQVVRLARGTTGNRDWERAQWHELLEHATRERCAPLAWLRSASVIRRFAPAAVANQWRAQALAAGELAAAQADELAALVQALSRAVAAPVVLKGLPLSALLYGDPGARPVFDIDLFVPVENRGIAHELLGRLDWVHLEGDPPAEGTYRRNGAARAAHLEIHSSLFDDALLAHIDCPQPEATAVDVGGQCVPAHTGDSLPVFLAIHLSKHAGVPLLWWIDFATCWAQLDRDQRERVEAAAARRGLGRFMSWAEQGAACLATICDGSDEDALDSLARLDALHHSRNALRVARLVEGFGNRVRVVLGWLVPVQHRSSPSAFARMTIRRISGRMKRATGRTEPSARRRAASLDELRTIVTDPATLAVVVRETTSAGHHVWIRARGTSMLPTIPRMAEVLIGPVPSPGLARGDVVLVDRPGSQLLMHRVVAASDEFVTLKGDNRFEVDLPVRHREVIGRALAIRVDGRVYSIPRRPLRSLRFALARLRTTVRRHASGG